MSMQSLWRFTHNILVLLLNYLLAFLRRSRELPGRHHNRESLLWCSPWFPVMRLPCALGEGRTTSWGNFGIKTIDFDTVGGGDQIQLDPNLWNRLPDDAIERIVAWLPVPSFTRLRTVCKKWNAFPGSNSFLDIYSQVPSKTPHLLMCADSTCNEHYAYNPVLDKWYSMSLDFLPRHVNFTVAAASGGLLCMINVRSYQSSVLYVCNPVTKIWRELLPMLRRRIPIIVSMLVDRQSKTFKLIVVGNYRENGNRTTEVYDSSRDSWEASSSVPKEAQVALGTGTAVCNGTLYCPTDWPDGLLAYDLEGERWSIFRAPMPSCLMFPYLVECDGQLVMVGEVRKRGVRSIGVWRLQISSPSDHSCSGTSEWKEVGRMPCDFFEKFREVSYVSFSCFGKGELIFLATNDNLKRLVYDLSRKTWRWLPTPPPLTGTVGLLQCFAFDPRLDSQV